MGISSEDLLYEIFVRLPLVSLLRCKSVSKSWYSLILKIDYFLRHRNDSNNNDQITMLLVSSHNNPIDYIDPTLDVFSLFRLKISLHMSMIKQTYEYHFNPVLNNTCNGLLLYHHKFIHSKEHEVSQYDNTVFYVCNPIIKHYIKLPNIKLKDRAEKNEYKKHMLHTRKACIVFDPSVSHSYKVIRCCLQRDTSYDQHVLYVYSSETRSWKLLTRFIGSFEAGFRTVLFKGVFYWYAEVGNVCLCFDTENENVWFLPLPKNPDMRRNCLYFGENGGHLYLIENDRTFNPMSDHLFSFPCRFNIMEMELQEDGRHCVWKVKYHVNINGGYEHVIQKIPKPYDVCIMHLYKLTTKEEEEEEALLMHIVGSNEVITYNITSNTFEDEPLGIPNITRNTSQEEQERLDHIVVVPVPYTPTITFGEGFRGLIPFTPTLVPVTR